MYTAPFHRAPHNQPIRSWWCGGESHRDNAAGHGCSGPTPPSLRSTCADISSAAYMSLWLRCRVGGPQPPYLPAKMGAGTTLLASPLPDFLLRMDFGSMRLCTIVANYSWGVRFPKPMLLGRNSGTVSQDGVPGRSRLATWQAFATLHWLAADARGLQARPSAPQPQQPRSQSHAASQSQS